MQRALTEYPLEQPKAFMRLRTHVWRVVLVHLLAAVLALTAIAAPVRADEIVVAAVVPRPGLVPGDADIKAVVAAALADAGMAGGLLGRPVRLITYEEDCSRTEAEATAGQIVARGAHLVIGHVCSAAAVAAAPIYARNGIVMIATGARSPRLTEPRAGPSIFRLAGRDDRFGAETAAFIATRFAGRRVAIVHDKSQQARGLSDAVDRELRTRGVTPVLREAYVAGEREYKKVIDALAAAEAEVVVVPAQPVEAGIILDGLRARNIEATLIGSEILAVPEIEAKAKLAGAGLILMLPWTHVAARSAIHDAGMTSALVRAGIEAWAHAVRRAQSTAVEAVGRILETEPAATTLGALRFDPKGDALIPSFAPHSWGDRQWRALAP